jgi:hypothetical protein
MQVRLHSWNLSSASLEAPQLSESDRIFSASLSSAKHSCFVFGRYRVQISAFRQDTQFCFLFSTAYLSKFGDKTLNNHKTASHTVLSNSLCNDPSPYTNDSFDKYTKTMNKYKQKYFI